MTSMAVHGDQDFSFPRVTDSSTPDHLFMSSSPSLWRISSLDTADFFDKEDNKNQVPSSPSPEVHGLEHDKERSASTCGGDGCPDENEDRGHDRTETMDILWEEFNFSEELVLQRIPSNHWANARGLDELHSKCHGSEYCRIATDANNDAPSRDRETGDSYCGVPFQLQPLDVSKKNISASSGCRSCSVSNSPKRQRKKVVMLKMVRKFLLLHKLARQRR